MRRACCGLKAALLDCLRLALNWKCRDREQPWQNSQLTYGHSFLHSFRYNKIFRLLWLSLSYCVFLFFPFQHYLSVTLLSQWGEEGSAMFQYEELRDEIRGALDEVLRAQREAEEETSKMLDAEGLEEAKNLYLIHQVWVNLQKPPLK